MSRYRTQPCPHCGGSGRVLADPLPKLQEARSKAGLSKSELARRLDVSATYVGDVEGGTRTITPVRVVQWLQECGTPTPWLKPEEPE